MPDFRAFPMRSLYSRSTHPISEWFLRPTSKPRSYIFFMSSALFFSASSVITDHLFLKLAAHFQSFFIEFNSTHVAVMLRPAHFDYLHSSCHTALLVHEIMQENDPV